MKNFEEAKKAYTEENGIYCINVPLSSLVEPEPEPEPVTVASKLNAIARLVALSMGFVPTTEGFDFAETQNPRAKTCYIAAKAIWCEIFGDVDPHADFEL